MFKQSMGWVHRLMPYGTQHDNVNLFILSLTWLAMIILVQPWGNFPLNDDWVYGLAVKSVLENGYYQFPSPSSANVGPLVYWGALFCLPSGFSFTALRVASLTLGFVGLLGMYGLSKTLGASPRFALLGALVLAVNPLYFGLANSFMTDVPFLAVVILALLMLIKGLQRDSIGYIVTGLVLTFVAILIRQLGVVVLVGFAAAYLVKYGFRWSNLFKAGVLVALGVLTHLAYQYWLVETVRTPLLTLHADTGHLQIPTLTMTIKKLLIVLMYMGFFIFPILPAFLSTKKNTSFAKHKKIIWLSILIFVTGSFLLLWWTGNMMPLTDNVLLESGLGPLTLRDTYNSYINYPAIPLWLTNFWMLITLLSVTCGGVIVYYLVAAMQRAWLKIKSQSPADAWVYALIAGMATSYFAVLMIIAANFPLFDRYFLVFLPLIFLLVVLVDQPLPKSVPRLKLSFVLIVLYAGFSIAATHDYLAWNRARWAATNDLMQQDKVSPKQIDGGYEFNGWYLYDAKYKHNPKKSWWWVVDDEYVIASGPLPGYAEMRRYTFNRWLLLSPSNIYVLRKSGRG